MNKSHKFGAYHERDIPDLRLFIFMTRFDRNNFISVAIKRISLRQKRLYLPHFDKPIFLISSHIHNFIFTPVGKTTTLIEKRGTSVSLLSIKINCMFIIDFNCPLLLYNILGSKNSKCNKL